ncbi:MAG: hypothetical protein JXB32_11350 [Deltaproteobacteria bacterium]|nr:hypothetical protein [Deltaproteobacteria bacterium]
MRQGAWLTGVVVWAASAAAWGQPAEGLGETPAVRAPEVPTYVGPTTGVVRLPWSDFRELVDRLRELQQPEETPPPTDSVISSAVYRIAVDNEEQQARIDAEIELLVLSREGWVDVPLLPDTAALEAFAVDGHAGTLTQRDGFHRLIARAEYVYYGTPTPRKVTMSYRLNVARGQGPHGLDLPLVGAGITRLELTLPRADQELRVEPGGVVLERLATPEGGTLVRALVPRAPQATLRWSDRAAPMQEEAVRAVADLVHRVAFQRHVVSGELALTVHVERGSFEAVVLRFPKEAEGIRAGGDFSVDVVPEGEAFQLATVRAGYARREDTSFVLRYELARNVGEVRPPDVKLVKLVQAGADREVVRQAGFLVLHAAEGMEVRAEQAPQGAEPCDLSEVPGGTELEGQAVLAYRISGLPYEVPLVVLRHAEREVLASAVQRANLDLMVNREGKAVGDLLLHVQNNERQFVGVWLPDGAKLWATFVRGLPVKPSGDERWVMIPVPRSVVGPDGVPETFLVEVLYYADVPRLEGLMGDGAFPLPRVDLLISSWTIALWVPDEYRYFAFEGDAKIEVESLGPVDLQTGRGPYDDHSGLLRQQLAANYMNVPEPAAVMAREAPEETIVLEEKAEYEEEEEGDTGARAADDEGRMGKRDAEDVDRMAGVMGPREVTSGRRTSAGEERERREALDHRSGVSTESRGLLPIRVDVPRQGLRLEFTRSLVEPKDETEVRFRYQGRTVLATFPWLRALAGLLLALGLARLAHQSLERRRLSVGVLAPTTFALGLVVAVVAGVALRAPVGGVVWSWLAGMVVYLAVVAAWLLWRYWRGQRLVPASAEAGAPSAGPSEPPGAPSVPPAGPAAAPEGGAGGAAAPPAPPEVRS